MTPLMDTVFNVGTAMAFIVIFALAVVVVAMAYTGSALYSLKERETGPYVAEVWLEWPICRGSTMYRQRFKSRRAAYLAVRLHAMLLDWHLPRYYWDTDWVGRALQLKHDYGIYYGVRKLNADELEEAVNPVWSTVLPGHTEYQGQPPGF